MRAPLNIQKSIEKERLIYDRTPSLLFNKIFENLRWLAFLAVPLVLILNDKNNMGFVGYLLFGILLLCFCIGMYFTNILFVIKGANLAENKKRINEILSREFPDWQFTDNGQNIIRRNKNTGLFSWGEELTVIFNDTAVLINLATLGRSEIKSPFHSIFNYLKIKRLSREF